MKRHACLLLCGLFVAGSGRADTSTLDVSRAMEESALVKLERVQKNPQNSLAAFTTDGCSGGLSEGWTLLAKTIPAFRRRFGERPPYESCCVVHDRPYWKGETSNGYDARLKADQELRQCVMAFGLEHRAQYAREFDVALETIDRAFRSVANAMYYAVRLGGGPCTPFPWRWGYGWPLCNTDDRDSSE